VPGALHGNSECLNFAPDNRDAKTIRTLALWHLAPRHIWHTGTLAPGTRHTGTRHLNNDTQHSLRTRPTLDEGGAS